MNIIEAEKNELDAEVDFTERFMRKERCGQVQKDSGQHICE